MTDEKRNLRDEERELREAELSTAQGGLEGTVKRGHRFDRADYTEDAR